MTTNEQRKIFAKNLAYYVSCTGKSQKDVAKDLGVNYTTFNMWMSGKSMPRMGMVQAIADYFHVRNIDLINERNAEDEEPTSGLRLVSVEDLPSVLPIYKHVIPVYPAIACGAPIEADSHAEYYAVSKEPIKADFAVIAKGDSMIDARINDGDLVFIEACSTVPNGEIAAVRIDGDATLKRVYYDAERQILSLVSENKAYAPMIYTKDDTRDIEIMGRAVCAQIFF